MLNLFKRLNVAKHHELAEYALGTIVLQYTQHSFAAAYSRNLPVFQSIEVMAGDIVELELLGKTIQKVVVRKSLDQYYDAVLVLMPASGSGQAWRVLSCWTNAKSDMHDTLRLERLTA